VFGYRKGGAEDMFLRFAGFVLWAAAIGALVLVLHFL
jgi:hypothetical protein